MALYHKINATMSKFYMESFMLFSKSAHLPHYAALLRVGIWPNKWLNTPLLGQDKWSNSYDRDKVKDLICDSYKENYDKGTVLMWLSTQAWLVGALQNKVMVETKFVIKYPILGTWNLFKTRSNLHMSPTYQRGIVEQAIGKCIMIQ